MKGVLFPLGEDHKQDEAHRILRNGLYGVWQKEPGEVDNWSENTKGKTNATQAGTFADFATLNEGDRVFIFTDRKIYGIGKLVTPSDATTPGIENYPGALEPSPNPDQIDADNAVYDGEDLERVRVVFPFQPGPALFATGVDMDTVLSSAYADFFPYLRFFEGRNLTLLTEEETDALTRILVRLGSRGGQLTPTRDADEFTTYLDEIHTRLFSIDTLVATNPAHHLKRDADDEFRAENWLHGLTATALQRNDSRVLPQKLIDETRKEVFREFPASPPKPPRWSDSIDLLTTKAHKYAPNLTTGYEIIEIKKDNATTANFTRHITQVLKYVEHITEHYADGDYGAVDAYYLANGYNDSFLDEYRASKTQGMNYDAGPTIERHYILDAHEDEDPTIKTWDALTLLEYNWNHHEDHLVISEVEVDPR